MKTILHKNALPFSFCLHTCNFLECSLHIVRSAQLKVPKNFIQLQVWYKTLGAWVGGSSSMATTRVGCLLSILWLNQDARVENSTETVSTAMSITIMQTASQWFKYDFQNLLVNISLKVSKFFSLSRWAAWRSINNLYNILSSSHNAKFTIGIYPIRTPPLFPDAFLILHGSHVGCRTIRYLETYQVTRPLSSQKWSGK